MERLGRIDAPQKQVILECTPTLIAFECPVPSPTDRAVLQRHTFYNLHRVQTFMLVEALQAQVGSGRWGLVQFRVEGIRPPEISRDGSLQLAHAICCKSEVLIRKDSLQEAFVDGLDKLEVGVAVKLKLGRVFLQPKYRINFTVNELLEILSIFFGYVNWRDLQKALGLDVARLI